jgi:hypothetical protein
MHREEATVIGLDAVGAALLADGLLRDGETLQSVWRTRGVFITAGALSRP